MKAPVGSIIRQRIVDLSLVLVALLGVVLVIASRGRVTTAETSARSGNVLSVWRPDDVTRLQIERPGEHIVLERQGGVDGDAGQSGAAGDRATTGWTLTSPIHEAADSYAVDKLLAALDHATWVRRIEANSVESKTLGLDTPRVVVKIQMGSIGVTLSLGKPAPSPQGAVYLEVSESDSTGRILLVPGDFVRELTLKLSDLRTRDLLPFDREELARIAVGIGSSRVEVRRTDRGDWVTATGLRAERTAIERMLVGLERATADRPLDVGEASQNLGQPTGERVTVEVGSRGASDATRGAVKLELGGRCPGDGTLIVALRQAPLPMAGCVPPSVPAALKSASEEVRGGSLFWLHPDEVEALDIELDGKKLALERKGSGFVLRAPAKGDVELEAGNERLAAITGLEGTLLDLGSASPPGLEATVGRVSLRSSAATERQVKSESVELGRARADGTFVARRTRDGAVLELPASALRLLTPDSTLLRSAKILAFAASDVVEIAMVSERASQRIVRTQSGVFDLVEPAGQAYDSAVIDDIVRTLGTLTAERWVADRDDGSFGLSRPRLEARVRLTGDAGPRERTLRVGDRAGADSYASVSGSEGVFAISGSTIDALDALALDRSVFMLSPEATRRIELSAGDRTLELVKRGDRFVASRGTLGPSQIQTLVDALSGLRAEAALHLGPPRPEEGLNDPLLRVRYVLEAGAIREWTLGSGDSWRSMSIHYARATGTNATYVVTRAPVRVVLDAL
jgi:hypothetical protein